MVHQGVVLLRAVLLVGMLVVVLPGNVLVAVPLAGVPVAMLAPMPVVLLVVLGLRFRRCSMAATCLRRM